jgi:hypothetical protein
MRQILPVGSAVGNDGALTLRSGPPVADLPIDLALERVNPKRLTDRATHRTTERLNDDGASGGDDQPVLD